MKCVTPMFRRYEQTNYKKGVIVPRSEVMQGLEINPNNIKHCLNKVNTYNRINGTGLIYEQIPCRHCWACSLNYSAEWATRIMFEAQKYTHNYWITLTYNDDWLPVAEKIELGEKVFENLGDEIWNEGTLWEPHVKKFIHDLRQYLERTKNHTGMKYFYCGEYGENTHRSHYHMILLNCPLDIKEFHKFRIDENYKYHWNSHEIERYWKYGYVDISELEWSNAAYTARYCMKKLHTKNDEEYAREGKLPEYIRMSRNIGRSYYEEHKNEIYKNDEIIMRTIKGNVGNFKPPKAWDRLFKEQHPEQWDNIKKSRKKAAERTQKLLSELSDYTDADQLQMNYEDVIRKGNQLPRIGEW